MQQGLEVIGRPFGEFISGGNAAEPGQIDKQIEIFKQLEIKGKTVRVPEEAEREARRKAREEAKSIKRGNSDN